VIQSNDDAIIPFKYDQILFLFVDEEKYRREKKKKKVRNLNEDIHFTFLRFVIFVN
jgi:hypothetical protein